MGSELSANVRCALWSRLDHDVPHVEEFSIFAPALAALPAGSLLVMATLPVLDWNGLLLAALERIEPADGRRDCAAVLMIDPFACWTDVADALKRRGFANVANFPPASFCHGATGSPDAFDAAEADRLAWFESEGFGIVRIAVRDDPSGRKHTPTRSDDGDDERVVVTLPAEALSMPVTNGMALPARETRPGPVRCPPPDFSQGS